MGFFEQHDCQLLGLSVDSPACHVAWAKSFGGLAFPLMADFYPHGGVAKKYGVLADRGYAERVIFLIDKKGIIRFVDRVDLAKLPDNERLKAAVMGLSAE